MKMMNKVGALLLSAVLCIGMVPTAASLLKKSSSLS